MSASGALRRCRAVNVALGAVLIFGAALAGGGCGIKTGSPDDAGTVNPDAPFVEEVCTPDADDTFCPMYASAFCAGHLACCTASGDPTLRYATMELCIQRTTCVCTAGRSGAAFDAGRVTFDAVAAEAVLAQLRDATPSCDALAPGTLDVEAAYVGTLAEGAGCSPVGTDYSNLFACASGLYCYVTDFGSATVPPMADCRRYRTDGETCDASGMTCAPGLYCGDGATIDDPGICRPLLAGGTACTFDFQCASDFCDDVAGNTCAPLDQDDTWCVDASAEP